LGGSWDGKKWTGHRRDYVKNMLRIPASAANGTAESEAGR
jgi:hypothetical protein